MELIPQVTKLILVITIWFKGRVIYSHPAMITIISALQDDAENAEKSYMEVGQPPQRLEW